jgi:hypothetical protein
MLAIRFLSLLRESDHDLNWSTSLQVHGVGEIDFLALCTRGLRGFDSNFDLLLGEAKLRKPLDGRDFERARRLRALLPEAVLVFATLNEKGFTGGERDRLRRLARPSVTSWRSLPARANVMLLTPAELYSSDRRPRDLWVRGTAGDASFGRFMSDPTAFACEQTQLAHLGLDPFNAWRTSEATRLAAAAGRRRDS